MKICTHQCLALISRTLKTDSLSSQSCLESCQMSDAGRASIANYDEQNNVKI